jgi:hypothetical protein
VVEHETEDDDVDREQADAVELDMGKKLSFRLLSASSPTTTGEVKDKLSSPAEALSLDAVSVEERSSIAVI